MKIGFIGLGAMGAPMATSLLRAEHEVQVHDLRKVDTFSNFKSTPAEAARGCELVFTSLPGPKEVEALAPALRASLEKGAAWFDLSTNSPDTIRKIHKEFSRAEIHVLDAPVSGGPSGAKSGKLAIWVGGSRAVYDKYEAVLRAIGDQPLYVGPIGAGTVAKLSHNLASFAFQAAMAEVFTLGVKAGVEPLALLRALRQGATGRKRPFDRIAENWLAGKFDPPSFALRLAHKDAALALEMARACNVPLKVGQIALDELDEAMRRGWSERDWRVAMTLQEERAGVAVRVAPEQLRAALED
jgi:3-hydroxyisobutyrate dehydrogenase